MTGAWAVAAAGACGAVVALVLDRALAGGRWHHAARRATAVERGTFHTLHAASIGSAPLRSGLAADTARRAVRRLRPLLGTTALCLTDTGRVLAWDGRGDHHRTAALEHARPALDSGRTATVSAGCDDPGCPVAWAVAAPLLVGDRVRGTLIVYGPDEPVVLVRATEEVARCAAAQLELADLDEVRDRLAGAEARALRAQISPHFIFNSLAAIASFVRTDPERARELLLECADFIRYSFRRHGDFTTLAEELHCVERYLTLVRARFGDRLQVTLRVAPEVLPVVLPFLSLQPLVENAVKHGIEGRPDRSRITITADDGGAEARVVIEDDGAGMEPDLLRAVLRGDGGPGSGIGLSNVDERLRQAFGDDHAMVVETGVGAGMRITVRIPKYRPGVHAS